MVTVSAQWNYPNTVIVGEGRFSEVVNACAQLHILSPLIVTDSGLTKLPIIEQILDVCDKAELRCSLFSHVKSNPTYSHVTQGVAAYHIGQHDGVIALGGGSVIDVAKAVALMVGQKRPLWDFEDIGDNWTRANEEAIAPVIAIPTTAGTGSEMGRASVITDEEVSVKKVIFHPKMLPKIVILDPLVTQGLPPHMTAATGMDALSHNLEAYCALGYHPMADGIALEAIRIIKQNLVKTFQNGDDLEARQQMLVASGMGATAFQKGLGAMHALAHSIGALYDSHHGLLNAILMPYVLEANRKAIEGRIARLAAFIELEDASFDGFYQWIIDIRKACDIPNTLSEIGIDADNAVLVGTMAIADAAASGNPIRFSRDEYRELFIKAVNYTQSV